MKSSLLLIFLASCATVAWPQATPSSGSNPAPPTPGTQSLKTRGPEATAQQEPTRVVAVIEGKQITAAEAAKMLKVVNPEDRKRYASNLPRLLQEIYMQQQFAQEAEKQHLDQQSPWKDQIELARANIMAQAYITKLTNVGGTPPDDPKHYYDTHPDEFTQAKVSGILVTFNPPGATAPASSSSTARTEDQAKAKVADLERKIKGGADFAQLAKAESDNKDSAARGGEIGTFAGDSNLQPDIKTAIFKLKKGEVSEPIRQQNGYYILKVEDRTITPFATAESQIIQKWQAQKGQEALKTQFDKYQIKVEDPDFFNASTAPSKIPSLANPSSSTAPKPAPQK